jgi:hypothetical protein
MEGKGSTEMLWDLIHNDLTRATYQHWVDENDDWIKRDDVQVIFPEMFNDPRPLSVGMGNPVDRFGPELEFGRIVGDRYDGPTLLIKTAWGGKDVAVDFRPPSRGTNNYTTWTPGYTSDLEKEPHVPQENYGKYYDLTVNTIQDILSLIERGEIFEGHTTWELKGLVWWQGWNDVIHPRKVEEYEANLIALFRDLRIDLQEPELPIVVGEMGQLGPNPPAQNWLRENILTMRRSQRAVTFPNDFHNTSRYVMTSTYVVENGAHYDGDYHYYGRADTYMQVGRAFGQTMSQLLEDIDHVTAVEAGR